MRHNAAGYIATARLLPPALPSLYVARPRLMDLLEEAGRRPLTTVVAGPGYGKSIALAAWALDRRLCWYQSSTDDRRLLSLLRGLAAAVRTRVPTLPAELASAVRGVAGPDTEDGDRADALAALLAESLDGAGGDELHLVVDGVDLLPRATGGGRLLAALARQAPARLRLILLTRGPIPFDPRRSRDLVDITSRDLSFSPDEATDLFRQAGLRHDLAAEVHTATGGWPAVIRLAAEALRDRSAADATDVLRRLHRPGGRLHDLLVDELLDRIAPARRELLGVLAQLPRATAELLAHLGVADAPAGLADLERRGLVVEAAEDADGWRTLPPLVRDAVGDEVALRGEDRVRVAVQAAGWLEKHGQVDDALELLLEAGGGVELAGFLQRHGQQLVATGACAQVARAAAALPDEQRTTDVRLVEGHARQVLGDWEGALAAFVAAGENAGPLPAAMAWRMGLIHHFRGDLDDALATYARGFDDHDDPVERAHLLAWAATAHWLRAELEPCRALVTEAFGLAREAGDPSALAITHTTLALVAAADGDRRANDSHYLRALAAAEEAGDVLQLLRIRCNRGSRHLEEGAYHEAIAELELALRLGEASGYAALHGLALCNRAEARLRLGRLEEAAADYETARQIYQGIDSGMVNYALGGLGDVHRARGDLTLARAAYEEAHEVAGRTGDAQGLAPALAGLARVVAAWDLAEATRLAADLLARAGGMGLVAAHLAAGWVALARGDRTSARSHAAAAEEAARSRRDRAGLAETLELLALAADDPSTEIARLDEAAAIWASLDEPIGEARACLAAARVVPGPVRRTDAARAARRLRDLGVSSRAAEAAGTLRQIAEGRGGEVEINALGGFAVLRDGQPVPLTAWQSRKARELVKILLARRGRPTPREQLIELLWPDEDPARASSRLSGLLSVARAVFDPDKQHDPNAFLVTDRHTIGLALDRVAVDVELFLATAAEGLALRNRDPQRARALLEDAESAYAGEVLEEDPYEDWAVPLREEARAAYIAVARALAADAAESGDADRAVRYLLRILERDPFDERAHLDLVGALAADGRHGEARRRYRSYSARMAELGVEAEPFARVPTATRS